ncbi:ATP-dependent helicase [Flavobacterium sp. S87F.05.LMB.W.Kidney.N]|uniref:ATP-dependent helicase n=1 Tax=Flavobacterium sp. S87F.05.LMB.W.Kidney.N TaxID=1278758 RepID=UPI0010650C56|nr:UvrD-helicase domain-containing protein [Flavobacterium sp. S87F.05.LMB.W.Kidney.N]TDX09945.1 DNA helicase-2/ATP-dependent DNA helicase PcrA [Flavobacterium sp. S87F.05.LMB.W.Kidney.N]
MNDPILDNLNPNQLQAVKTTEGYVRVIAGAGSGKTKALTSRFAYIVDRLGINSSNILCVTFTNKAAQEMKKRVKALIGDNYDVSFITTYHGFCVRFLREEINKIHYPKNFIILDAEDQKSILRDVFTELQINSKHLTFKQVLRFISKQKSTSNYLGYILENKSFEPDESDSLSSRVFQIYLDKQKRNYALDFDDLIHFTAFILDNNPDVLLKWQENLHYIQVDEAQDSSESQFHLVEMLSRVHQNLFLVGDPDQTIYEWRGAKPEYLVEFDTIFPDTQTIIMNRNYRSTPNILKVGNHIIKNNTIRVDKDMITDKPEGFEVVHFHGKNDFEESRWIASEIKEILQSEDASYSDITILYRSNHLSRNIEQALIKDNIPYTIFGGIRFFERKEIKDVLSMLRLIVQGDNFSFLRMHNQPTRGLGKKFLERLSLLAGEQNLSLLQALEKNIADKELAKKGAVDFLALINELRETAKTKSISDLVKIILDKSGLSDLYRKDGDEDRLENIKELVNSMLLLEKENNAPVNIVEYLQEIALYTDLDADTQQQDKVRLMTIHISKGLEFPYVFLCGFTEGILPSALSIKERRKRAIEEERRLMYVAVTRAEKRFYMTDSEGFNFTTGLNKYPSRFLFEISEEFYVRKGKLSPEIIQNNETKSNVLQSDTQTTFKEGDLVMHPVWNKGKVKTVDVEKNQYIVEFAAIAKEKPIDFSFKHLTYVEDADTDETADFTPKDLQQHLKSAPNPFEKTEPEPKKNVFEETQDSSLNKDKDSGEEEKKWWKPWS